MNEVTVISRKFDLSVRRSWTCRFIEQKGELLVFVGEFDQEVDHPELGRIEAGTLSYEYYWLDRWYNIFRFHNPDGTLRNYYCNINMPPVFDGKTLDYVDLDIDVLVWPDWRVTTLDEAEFESNSMAYSYPPRVRKNTFDSLTELQHMIKARKFPFDTIAKTGLVSPV